MTSFNVQNSKIEQLNESGNNYKISGSGSKTHSEKGKETTTEVSGEQRSPLDLNELQMVWNLLHPKVRTIAFERFCAEQYADAVEATFKELNSEIKSLVIKLGAPELDGRTLMQTAFSPNKPLIVLADLATQSGRDMQLGFMEIFAGVMSAIRNPKAHANISISPERSLHLLFIASTLWHTLDMRP